MLLNTVINNKSVPVRLSVESTTLSLHRHASDADIRQFIRPKLNNAVLNFLIYIQKGYDESSLFVWFFTLD